ncbi:MAG: hypothetical protein ACFCD0_07540 [Gemmataceae bacterium]
MKWICYGLVVLLSGLSPVGVLGQTRNESPLSKEQTQKRVSAESLEIALKKALAKSFEGEFAPKVEKIVVQYLKSELEPLKKNIIILKSQLSDLEVRAKYRETDINALRSALVRLQQQLDQLEQRPGKDMPSNFGPVIVPPTKSHPDKRIARKKNFNPELGVRLESDDALVKPKKVKDLDKEIQLVKKLLAASQKRTESLKRAVVALEKTNQRVAVRFSVLSRSIRALKKQTTTAPNKNEETATILLKNTFNEELVFKITQPGMEAQVERVPPNGVVDLPKQPPGTVTCTLYREYVGAVSTIVASLEPNGRICFEAKFPFKNPVNQH